jgi:small-conductance mechanosensitive channel
MIILSNLGVNIGPLLAGAGIIGVAIGFGSQTLVRDIVSGAFFLIDDAFRVGEYVETGSVKGTVEKIAIRSLRLRHHRGLVHTIPYGEIRSVTNYSRDWVIMKLEFRLPYGTDIEKVRKLIKKVGQEMEADEALAKGMLAPLKSQGVTRMEDSALIFRAKFTAKPGEQFVLRREAYRRMQETLLENGIGFAPARVQVEIADSGRTLSDADKEKIAGAAAAHQTAAKPA